MTMPFLLSKSLDSQITLVDYNMRLLLSLGIIAHCNAQGSDEQLAVLYIRASEIDIRVTMNATMQSSQLADVVKNRENQGVTDVRI
jgi:hypothetical protein